MTLQHVEQVYMLFTETSTINGETLGQKFSLVILSGDTLPSDLGAQYDAEGHGRSKRA